jgi:hypothetical protein
MKINYGEDNKIMIISRKSSGKQITINHNEPQNVEYFICFSSLTIINAKYTREINSGVATIKAAFKTKKTVSPSKLAFTLNTK